MRAVNWLSSRTRSNLFYQLIRNFMLHAPVTNLFNKQPPVDGQMYGSGSTFFPYDAAFHQDGAVGRYFLFGFDCDF